MSKTDRHLRDPLPYGWIRDQRTKMPIPHPTEQRIIDRICRWHDRGRTPHQIATQLEEDGVPAKKNGAWHNEVIKRILRRAGKIT